MPNWCNNIVTLVHEDRTMISRAVKSAQKDALLNEFAPVPQALADTTEGSYGDKLEQARLMALREVNVKTYGYSSWYDFAIGEWGCKWDISNGGDDYKIKKVANGYTVTLSFDTAWSPPINFYDKLVELEFEVDAMYYEPGVNFCGRYYDGQDEIYDLTMLTSEAVKDQLPEELDQMFGISEQMAEYEAEQEEEENE
jgi:hypothetical protein